SAANKDKQTMVAERRKDRSRSPCMGTRSATWWVGGGRVAASVLVDARWTMWRLTGQLYGVLACRIAPAGPPTSRYDIRFVNPIISRRLDCWQAAHDVNVRVVRAAACDEPAAGGLTYLSGCLGRGCYRGESRIGQPQKTPYRSIAYASSAAKSAVFQGFGSKPRWASGAILCVGTRAQRWDHVAAHSHV